MTKLVLHTPESGKNLSDHYKRAFSQGIELFVVTAYLTDWDTSLKLTPDCRHFRMIVGRDFGITRKIACSKVMGWLPPKRKAEFLVADRIVGFHPKAVFWREKDRSCYALVGSSNLTLAAFNSNYEANALVQLDEREYLSAKQWLKNIEKKSVVMSQGWLNKYNEAVFSSQGISKGINRTDREIPVSTLDLPRPPGMKAQITERRQQLAAYQTKRVGLTKLFRRCADEEIDARRFFEELPMYWSSEAGDRLQGLGWERRGKDSNFQELSKSFLAILEASSNDRDDAVQEELDRLATLRVSSRGAFLSEMLCLRFPKEYPVLNDPVWLFLEEVRFTAPRGASEGAKYIHLAKTLRASLLDNPTYPAKNLAELDTVIWLKYRRNNQVV